MRTRITLGVLAVVACGSGCSVVSTTVDVTTKVVRTSAEVTATVASAGASVVGTGVKTAAAVGAAGASAASATVAAGAAARAATAAVASAAVNGTVALIELAQSAEDRRRQDEIAHLRVVSTGGGRYVTDAGRVLRSTDCVTEPGTPALWVMRRDGSHELRVVAPRLSAQESCTDARFMD
ncbi:MAG: hypothetical protein ACK4XK_12135 [Casimicrobiaceae bacterium]